MTEAVRVSVAVETPQHARIGPVLDYESEQALPPGTLVRVPLGKRDVPGIVWTSRPDTRPDGAPLKRVAGVLEGLPPLAPTWLALVDFAAGYYQRGVGELALTVLPPELRRLDAVQLARRLKRLQGAASREVFAATPSAPCLPELTDDQATAMALSLIHI